MGVQTLVTLTGATGRPGIELVSYPFTGAHSSASNVAAEVGDVDHDGKADIVVVSGNNQDMQIWTWAPVNADGNM
jgi:anaerobic selenocysteine-containing dehydrogenase